MNLDFLEDKNVNSEIPILFDYIEAILAKEFSLNKIDSEMFTMSVILNRSGLTQDILFLNTCRAELKEIPNLNMADLETDLREACKNKYISTGYRKPTEIKLSPKFKAIIEEAYILSKKYGDCLSDEETPLTLLAPHHILLAINKHDEEMTTKVFKEYGIKFNLLEKIFINKIDPHTLDSDGNPVENNKVPELPVPFQTEIKIINSLRNNNPISNTSELKTVSKYCENITEYVLKQGDNLKIVGRDKELKTMFNTLVRKNKNNVILCGETGVGRTSLVYKLAQSILEGSVPKNLVGKEIWSLNVGKTLINSKYRGEFESRMVDIVEELKKNEHIILLINDMHTIFGSGNPSGALDVANFITPLLIDGNTQVIGTTNNVEYRRIIEGEKQITSKFQKLIIEEATIPETIEIIKNIKSQYEKHHNISISDELIEKLVNVSKRYLTNRVLPDSAIDVLDTCGASVQKIQPVGYVTKKQLEINEVELQMNELRTKRKKLMDASEYDDMSVFDKIKSDLETLEVKLKEIKSKPEKVKKGAVKVIKEDDINSIISNLSGIPISKISNGENNILVNLEKNLNNSVIGQKEAVKKISESIIRSRVGFRKKNSTVTNLLFIAKSGVGKTFLVKKLAEELFGSEDNLIRIDMSEYSDPSSITKLIGSPPSYVGYAEGGQLTEKIKNRPYSIILWDEVEKANSLIYNVLLQLFDEGHITDGKGNKIDCRNTINILTSNVGTKKATDHGVSIGYSTNKENDSSDKTKNILSKELKNKFPPEFLNRLNEIIYFNELTKDDLKLIISNELNERVKIIKSSMGLYNLKYDSKLVDFILNKIENSSEFGARPINRIIETEIETPLALKVVNGNYSERYVFKISVVNDSLEIV